MADTKRWGAPWYGGLVVWVLAALPALAQDPRAAVGEWGPVMTWPGPAVHSHLLPDGKVMFSPEFEHGDEPRTWEPQTGAITNLSRAGYNFFCAGHAFLPDGRLLVTGGHISSGHGYKYTSIYDYLSNTWTRAPDMNAGRWYPTNTPLPNGEMLVLSGTTETAANNTLPQVFRTDGTWRDLTSARLELPYYPWMFLAPDGRVFFAGPSSTSHYLDTTGTGAWTTAGSRVGGSRSEGSAVLYDEWKVLTVGGSSPPKTSAEIIDLAAASPRWSATGSMRFPRRQHNATLLPDGTVLVTGGSSGSGFDDNTAPVKAAELWNPATGAWTVMASEARYRGYHSTALLLPDGRVLSAGGRVYEPTAQLFSPPYLFKGARPLLSSAPASVDYGATFDVGTPDAASISRVTLIRLASVTHTFNQNQAICRLGFSQGTGGLRVTAPTNRVVCPPGHYMLFLLNGSGVPSVAKIIRVGGALLPPPPPPPPPVSVPLFTYGSTWKYHDGAVDLGSAWVSAAYDDSGWKSGVGELGYGDGDEATRLAKTSPSQPSVYFRKKLRLDSPVSAAELRVRFDDGVAVWVNGTLVFSRNMGNGTAYAAWASGSSGDNAEARASIPLSPNPFVVGDNVVAVMVKQASSSSSDTSFDLALSATFSENPPPPPPTPHGIPFGSEWKYHDGAVDLGSGWVSPGYDDSVWRSGRGQLGYGDGDEATRLTKTSPSQPSVYFRKKLHLDAPVSAASLRVLFDDGVAVWVNGTLVFSRNMGNGTAYSVWASGSSGDNAMASASISLSPNPFVVGDNVIAVMVKQVGSSSSDTSFDLELNLQEGP